MEVGNIKSASVSGNVMTGDGSWGNTAAIALNTGSNISNSGSGVGINNLTISNNVVNKWYAALEISGAISLGGSGYKSMNNLSVHDNQFQNVTGDYDRLVSHGPSINTGEEAWSNNKYYDDGDSGRWFFSGSSAISLTSWKSKLESTAQNAKMAYNNPNASISTYAGSFGSFMTEARKTSSDNFRGTYTAKNVDAYIRGAFNMGSVISSPTPTPTPTPTTTDPGTSFGTDTRNPLLTGYIASATSIKFDFDENVQASLSTSDLIVKNTSNGSVVSSSAMAVSYDTKSNVATFTFPNLTNDKLASGTYSVSLPDQYVTDAAGNRLGGGKDIVFSFNTSTGTHWGTL
jgi:hypothetical protein